MSDPNPTREPIRMSGDLSGRQVGGFHLLRRLGKGAMAEVYLAEQPQLKRWVAVKILKPELAGDATYVRRFEREALAAARLVHANIVQIHEVGHVDGLHYIVQEYVQGQNLREWLARNGPPLLQPALSIMRQIAAALGKAAEQGVVHRDIKPENIMITAAGEVKVADFGLARVLNETSSTATALTQVGITMGTPLYMSPEQVEGRMLDHRSDLYSFGVVCYHLLTGKPPFTGDTALAVAVQHVKTQPQPLELQRADLPPALCRVVHQMLAKDPEQRWRSCGEVLRELYRIQLEYCPQPAPEEAAAWSSIGMEPISQPRMRATRQLAEAMRSTAQRPKTWSRALVALGILVLFVLGGVTAWCTMRPPLLTPPPDDEKVGIPHEKSELRQWFFASRFGTEEAWKSVIDYPGVSDLTKLRAKQQLARVYFHEQDYEKALTLSKDLADGSHKGPEKDNYAEFTAFGLALKGVILSREEKWHDSAEVMTQLWNYRDDLRDGEMKNLVQKATVADREHLGAASGKELNDWFKAQSKPKGQPAPD